MRPTVLIWISASPATITIPGSPSNDTCGIRASAHPGATYRLDYPLDMSEKRPPRIQGNGALRWTKGNQTPCLRLRASLAVPLHRSGPPTAGAATARRAEQAIPRQFSHSPQDTAQERHQDSPPPGRSPLNNDVFWREANGLGQIGIAG
jgi:hypothetical protein